MVLLLSGGLDSFIAYHYLGKPKTVYFDLNTPYTEKEIKVVLNMAPDTIIDKSLRHLGETQVGVKAYIPFRNLYLAMSSVRYSDEIIIAGIKGDDVSDKNEQVFNKFSVLLSELEGREITVSSPFWKMTKDEIVRWYLVNVKDQIDLVHETVSCYSSGPELYCGACPCCFRKWVTLTNNGYDIPFHNGELLEEYVVAAANDKYIPERNDAIIQAMTNKCLRR